MGDVRWFCRGDDEWNAIAERLKLMPCPHCDVVGELIRHGYAYGFDETNPRHKTVRGRRIFCSNRNRRRGCGLTFCIWLADSIRRLSLTTRAVWTFLQLAVAGAVGALAAAIRAADAEGRRSDRTWQRLWTRFLLGQSKIRTTLLRRCPPPESPAASQAESPTKSHRRSAAQVLAHLKAAFPDADCPIAAFQHSTRSFFV
jgi:hypothetical protein